MTRRTLYNKLMSTIISHLPEGGREHAERRIAQARAAQKPRVKGKFHKATRKSWKKEL